MGFRVIERDANEIQRLYVEERLSLKDIAAGIWCNSKTIRSDLLALGIRIRGFWEQRKIDERAGRATPQSEHANRLNAAGTIGGIRDGYCCLMCGKEQGRRKLSVHHVDYDRWNNDECNLATLCIACHCKTNVRRKAWIAFFSAFGLGPGRGKSDGA